MALRLARDLAAVPYDTVINRFDPLYWTIDYNALMVATIVPMNDNSFKVPAQWRSNVDFLGVKWTSEDRYSHEYFKYSTDNDYSHTILAFRHNPTRPRQTTVTIHARGFDYTYRTVPYVLDTATNNYVPLDPDAGTGRFYPADVIGNPGSWTAIPDGEMVAYRGRKDYIFIIDFQDLRILADYTGIRVPPDELTGISFDVVQSTNGLSDAAIVTNIETTGTPGLLKATITNCNPYAALTVGDVLTILYSAGGHNYEELITVESWTGFGTTTFLVYFRGTHHGTYGTMNGMFSRYLKTASPAPRIDATAYFTDIKVTGLRTTLLKRHNVQTAHNLMMTSGFDDGYNLTPQRQVRMTYDLGYRGFWTTYLGMSHYFNAETVWRRISDGVEFAPGDSGLTVDHPELYYLTGRLVDYASTTTPVNPPTVEFYKAFFAEMKIKGYTFVHSVSYEILNLFMPQTWNQRDYLGRVGLSGWVPPSSFIQPSNPEPLNWMAATQAQIICLALAIDLPIKFQIGEPWWWDGSYSNNAPCIYDAFTLNLYHAETGLYAPTPYISSILDPIDPIQFPYIDWLCIKLGQSTDYIRDQTRALVALSYPSAHVDATLLFFTPQILSLISPLTTRLNFPTVNWAYPAYDFVQIEDYDFIIAGRLDLVPQTFNAATDVLGYPKEVVHYFVGFVLLGSDYKVWEWASTAVDMAVIAEMAYIYLWSYTQVMRDGVVVDAPAPAARSRVLINLPVNFSSPYDVSIEYKTETIASRAGLEQRRALRDTPRKTIQFSVALKSTALRKFKATLAGWQNRTFLIPQLTRRVFSTTDLPHTSNVVGFASIPGWIQLGATVFLERPDGKQSWREVARISGNSVTFQALDPDGVDWPVGTQFFQALEGTFDASIAFKRHTSQVSEAVLIFDVTPGSECLPWFPKTPSQSFQGVEVVSRRPNQLYPFELQALHPDEVVDFGRGKTETFRPIQAGSRTYKATYLCKSFEDADDLEGLFTRTSGAQGAFFMPTWDRDMELASSSAPGGSVLTMQGPELYDFMRQDATFKNIAIVTYDGVVHPFAISSMTSDGTNTALTLGASVSSDIFTNILMICWMPLWRMASDKITFSWITLGVGEVSLGLQTLQDVER